MKDFFSRYYTDIHVYRRQWTTRETFLLNKEKLRIFNSFGEALPMVALVVVVEKVEGLVAAEVEAVRNRSLEVAAHSIVVVVVASEHPKDRKRDSVRSRIVEKDAHEDEVQVHQYSNRLEVRHNHNWRHWHTSAAAVAVVVVDHACEAAVDLAVVEGRPSIVVVVVVVAAAAAVVDLRPSVVAAREADWVAIVAVVAEEGAVAAAVVAIACSRDKDCSNVHLVAHSSPTSYASLNVLP
jgi:hypothetical protein